MPITMGRKKPKSVDPSNPWPKRLKRLREQHGDLTQEEAAAKLGIPVTTLQNWEQGRTRPRGAAARLIELTFPE